LLFEPKSFLPFLKESSTTVCWAGWNASKSDSQLYTDRWLHPLVKHEPFPLHPFGIPLFLQVEQFNFLNSFLISDQFI